jgi:hypothetical protein
MISCAVIYDSLTQVLANLPDRCGKTHPSVGYCPAVSCLFIVNVQKACSLIIGKHDPGMTGKCQAIDLCVVLPVGLSG